MIKNAIRILFLLVFAPFVLLAQNGKISGKITDETTREAVPFVTVKAVKGGQFKGGTVADIDGNYDISPLTPGSYDIEISCVGYKSKKITGVTISFETTTRLNIKLSSGALEQKTVTVEAYKVPLISKDETSTGKKFTAADIEKLPTRNLNAVMTTAAGVYSSDDGGDLNIRGNRSGDNAVFINGVRQFGTTLPPVEAVEDLAVITGGVPAQYGDALGGIISITTKSAAKKFYGSMQLETSRPFDHYNYDLLGGNVSGPILRRQSSDSISKEKKTLVGFFGALQYTGVRDDSPSAYGYYTLTDDAKKELNANPVVNVNGKYYSSANFFTADKFTNQSYMPGNGGYSLQGNGNLDFQPTDNTLITLGGNFNYNQGQRGQNFNFFNSANNPAGIQYDYNVFLRLRQSFNNGLSAEKALLRNIYYQVQVDASHNFAKYYDPNLGDDLARYNYVGEFKQKKVDEILLNFQARSLSSDSSKFIENLNLSSTGNKIYKLHDQDLGLEFKSNQYSNGIANINNAILKENPFAFSFLTTNSLSSLYSVNGAAINGTSGYTNAIEGYPVGYTYAGQSIFGGGGYLYAPGTNFSGYGYTSQDQYRLSAQSGADIGRHSLKLGFEFEQRIIRGYSGNTNLYARGRALLNQHLYQGSEGAIIKQVTRGYGDTVDVYFQTAVRRDPTTNAIIGQTDFDKNLRASLGGVAIDKVLNIDEITPDKLNLNQFSVSDIFSGASNPMTSWFGYNAYGEFPTKATSFTDFFTDTLNRPVDAFRPIYVAGYIEDKFEINDLIIRLGLRVDRFDVNTPVLKDRYSLTKLTTVGDLGTDFSKFKGGQAQAPAGIGSDYSIYLDKSALTYNGSNQGDFTVVGYRSGSQWYDASGSATQSSQIEKLGGGTVNPWFQKQNIAKSDVINYNLLANNKLTLDAFEDFKPQINVMPRLSFSFPISEQALFFAHYDVLTQRPLTAFGGQNYASPILFYALSQGTGSALFAGSYPYLPNSNLQPQKKIDYQIGFQQLLTQKSAVKFSAFYQEIKDLIQIITVLNAYPNSYQTDGNQDFGISKGITAEYDLRRTGGFSLNASYTLQFAEVSNSNLLGNLASRIANSTLRDVFPAGYDQRHAFKLNMDFRFKENEGPVVFGRKIFENVGINFTNYLGSGTPYSRIEANYSNNTFAGQYNGSRLPWNYRAGLRIDKSFNFVKPGGKKNTLNVYIYVQNLFNAQNITGVYARTGSTTDDGYLGSAYGRQQEAVATTNQSPVTYELYYNLRLLNPDLVTIPRRTRIGMSYNF